MTQNPTFTTKHYVWLASFFRDELAAIKKVTNETRTNSEYELYCQARKDQLEYLIKSLSDELKSDNPKFNPDRFHQHTFK